MARTTLTRIGLAALCCAVLLSAPRSAAAQSSTFIIPLNTTVINPCTADTVTIAGSSTVSITQRLDGTGGLHIDVGVVSKGIGVGLAAQKYVFSESQQFSLKLSAGLQQTESDFSDKFSLKGARAVDNWTIRARFHITINSNGEVTSLTETLTGDVCKG